eukprot:11044085-Karenia_brevis.AAC.1
MDTGKVPWLEFADDVENWAAVLHPDAPEYLARYTAEEPGSVIDNAPSWLKRFQMELFNMLRNKVRGKGRDVVMAAERPNGLKAWHALSSLFDPKNRNESLHAYKVLMDVPRAKDSTAALVALAKWVTASKKYENGFGDKLAENSKMNIIEQIMPREDYERAIRGGTYKTFDEMYERAKTYLRDLPGTSTSKKPVKTVDDDRMDVDSLEKKEEVRERDDWINWLWNYKGGKDKGKGKGKSYGPWSWSWGGDGGGKKGKKGDEGKKGKGE